MDRHHVLIGIATSLLASAMSFSGDAHASRWIMPTAPCNASNLGEVTVTVVNRESYSDAATHVCEESGWVLLHVRRCYQNGSCITLD